jgi:5-methylcytosine-specific restriction endonuclease McrA
MDFGGNFHIDVVDKDFNLMNVDHIMPKSQGGGEEMENKQPMCERHNSKKAAKLVPY